VGTITEESNDYFATLYQAPKNGGLDSLLRFEKNKQSFIYLLLSPEKKE
jgi:hypothetical protein